MPTYQYRCTECGEQLEVVQKFTDAALTVCPNCQGPLRKVFNAVGVVFKGSGFYRTDSRKGSSSDTAGEGKPSVSTSAKDGAKESGSTGGSTKNGSSESAPKSGDSSSSSDKKSSSASTNGSSKPSVGAGSSS